MGKRIEKKNEKKTARRTVQSVLSALSAAWLMICLVGMTLCLSGCGTSEGKLPGTDDAALLKPFLGSWQCEETPLERDDIYTGYLHLEVQEDSSYSMYDIEAGNPGIEGTLEIQTEDTMVIHIHKTVDTDFPGGWENMSMDQPLMYRFTEDGKLEMSLADGEETVTLVFQQS
ncbi:MAG: hypothetical protein ACI4WY_05670 [Anaerovoracaceae bacterium]